MFYPISAFKSKLFYLLFLLFVNNNHIVPGFCRKLRSVKHKVHPNAAYGHVNA